MGMGDPAFGGRPANQFLHTVQILFDMMLVLYTVISGSDSDKSHTPTRDLRRIDVTNSRFPSA